MTNLVEKTKSQRKTWTIPKYIAEELDRYSYLHGKKQSQIVALALEEFLYNKTHDDKVKKRLQALNSLIGTAPEGSLKDLDVKEAINRRVSKDV